MMKRNVATCHHCQHDIQKSKAVVWSGYWQVILEKVIPAWQLFIAIATRHPQNQIPKYPEYRPLSRYYMVGRNYQITLTSCKLQCKTVPHWSRFWKYELCGMLQDLSCLFKFTFLHIHTFYRIYRIYRFGVNLFNFIDGAWILARSSGSTEKHWKACGKVALPGEIRNIKNIA